jgi:methyl-accepting chemotaxis protein
VTGFAAAIEQVKRATQQIDAIAQTTGILALNATIEAQRAGVAGRAFSVVASEVKALAQESGNATKEIGRTVGILSSESELFLEEIRQGALASEQARTSVRQIEGTLGSVNSLVREVDSQNDLIIRSMATTASYVNDLRGGLLKFDQTMLENDGRLHRAGEQMFSLELVACDMFDQLVKAGISVPDSAMVEVALSAADRLARTTLAALEANQLELDTLFDEDYKEIEDTEPTRYYSRLSIWADKVWRPILDDKATSNERIELVMLSNRNGFLPTHMSERSHMPTGDIAYDTKYCRNGRIVWTRTDERAMRNTSDYLMAVHRQEGDGRHYEIVRDIFVPIRFDGRRWGDFVLCYI